MKRAFILLISLILLSSILAVPAHSLKTKGAGSIGIRATMDSQVYLRSQEFRLYYTIFWKDNNTPIFDAPLKWYIMSEFMDSVLAGPFWSNSSPIISEKLEKYNLTTGKYKIKMESSYTLGNETYVTTEIIVFYIGNLDMDIAVWDLTSPSRFHPGDDIKISIAAQASYSYISSPLKNAFINYTAIGYMKDGNFTILDNFTSMLTGADGVEVIEWTIPDLPDGTSIYILSRVEYGDSSSTSHYTFQIMIKKYLTLEFNKDYYISGDSMELYAYSNADVVTYQFEICHNSLLLYFHSGPENSISYYIPLDYEGSLEIKVYAYLSDGTYLYQYRWVDVEPGILELQASQHSYRFEGESIEIFADVESNVMKNPTYYYKIFNDEDEVVKNISTKSPSINFTVPDLKSKYYMINVKAVDGKYAIYNTLVLWREDRYCVHIKILTQSRYAGNTYLPGDSIKIGYHVLKYGMFNYTNPVLRWKILNTQKQGRITLNDSALNGTFTIKIPSDFHGDLVIVVWIDAQMYSSDESMVSLQVKESSWAMEEYGGVPLGIFISLLIGSMALIIGIVILLLLLLRKRREEFPRPRAPRPFKEREEEILEPEEEFGPEL